MRRKVLTEEEMRMNAFDIMKKTMKFVWLKLGFGAAMTGIVIVLIGLAAGIGALTKSSGVFAILLCIGMIAFAGVFNFAMNYIGHMLKAGHIAVVAHAVTTGQVPDNQFEFGKQMVAERFVTTNAYLVVDRLVSGAVRQLQNAVGKVGEVLDFIPGMDKLTDFVQTFIRIALGYVDECCLGYCFVNKEKSAFEASCDGVVIYFQNAKKLLKDAALTTLIVMVATFLSWFVPFLILMPIFSLFKWNITIAAFICIFIAVTIKSAFVDTYVMVKMMVSYMEVAPATELSFDLYDKLCGLSAKFRELFDKARAGVTSM